MKAVFKESLMKNFKAKKTEVIKTFLLEYINFVFASELKLDKQIPKIKWYSLQ